MKRAFTLIELLVVITIISVLMAITLPALRGVREQSWETECKANLRQMAIGLKTYLNDHDQLFPNPRYIYHAERSFDDCYPTSCRWHDEEIGFSSALFQGNPELQGALWAYLKAPKLVLCKVGQKANKRGDCNNEGGCLRQPDGLPIKVVPQYTNVMNAYLGSSIMTSGSGSMTVDPRGIRRASARRDSQVSRSPSSVFAFAEENSWAVNTEGLQIPELGRLWPAAYNLSGKIRGFIKTIEGGNSGVSVSIGGKILGALRLPALDIRSRYRLEGTGLTQNQPYTGDAFATYHRPYKDDLNTGHSYVVMLDGHVEKVTVADQLRGSSQIPDLAPSQHGPGGNLALAWPSDIPPPGGWENQ